MNKNQQVIDCCSVTNDLVVYQMCINLTVIIKHPPLDWDLIIITTVRCVHVRTRSRREPSSAHFPMTAASPAIRRRSSSGPSARSSTRLATISPTATQICSLSTSTHHSVIFVASTKTSPGRPCRFYLKRQAPTATASLAGAI
jgi:hypothetical protein